MTAVRFNLGCVAFNNSADLGAMISSLEQWAPKGLNRCLLVDHSTESGAKTLNYELAVKAGWEYFGQPNMGFGSGVNRLVSMSQDEEVLVVLNLDVLFREAPPFYFMTEAIQKGAFSWVGTSMLDHTGTRVAGRLPKLGLGMILHDFGKDMDEDASVGSSWQDVMPWDGAVHGGCFAVRVKDFRHIDGIDEALFLYAEEFDLAAKFRRAQLITGFLVSDSIIHASEGEARSEKQFLNRYNLRYLAKRERRWGLFFALTLLLTFDLFRLHRVKHFKTIFSVNLPRPALLQELFPLRPSVL